MIMCDENSNYRRKFKNSFDNLTKTKSLNQLDLLINQLTSNYNSSLLGVYHYATELIREIKINNPDKFFQVSKIIKDINNFHSNQKYENKLLIDTLKVFMFMKEISKNRLECD
jgi:hypothetical protein